MQKNVNEMNWLKSPKWKLKCKVDLVWFELIDFKKLKNEMQPWIKEAKV